MEKEKDILEVLLEELQESTEKILEKYTADFKENPQLDAIHGFKKEVESAEKIILTKGQQNGLSNQLELVKGAQDVLLTATSKFRKILAAV